MTTPKNRRILVIDDNESIHDDFRKILGAQLNEDTELSQAAAELFGEKPKAPLSLERFQLDFASQGSEGLEKVEQARREGKPYALTFVDIRMPPGWDGVETARRLWKVDPNLQVVICTAHSDYSLEEMYRLLGCSDLWLIVKKPFDNIEVFQLAAAMTEKWDLARKSRDKLNDLEQVVEQRTREILATRDMTVFVLAQLAESRDPETGRHLERIRSYSQILAEQLCQKGPYTDRIDEQFMGDLYRASPLHDIGKVGIPDAILLKPGRLTSEEFDVIKRHSTIGADALDRAVCFTDSAGFLAMASEVARYHHERFDGSGYPDGLIGQEIPLSARIVALADVYDALCSSRVYKDALDPHVARLMIEEQRGRHFDPAIVDAFCDRWDEFLRIAQAASNLQDPVLGEEFAPARS